MGEFCTFRLVFGFSAMCYSMFSISLLGFFVWAHHMFTVGLDLDSRVYFGVVTLCIGLPTCIKIFNWFYMVWGFDVLFCDFFLFVLEFFVMFLVCGFIFFIFGFRVSCCFFFLVVIFCFFWLVRI